MIARFVNPPENFYKAFEENLKYSKYLLYLLRIVYEGTLTEFISTILVNMLSPIAIACNLMQECCKKSSCLSKNKVLNVIISYLLGLYSYHAEYIAAFHVR